MISEDQHLCMSHLSGLMMTSSLLAGLLAGFHTAKLSANLAGLATAPQEGA
jgi:hypothetical protein